MQTPEQRVAENLRSARHKAGLTQRELGEQIGIGDTSISLWEKGERVPSIVHLARLCRVLHCSADELLQINLPPQQESASSIVWTTAIPESASLRHTTEILDGIDLVRRILNEKTTYTQFFQSGAAFSNASPLHLCQKINAAFLAGGITLIDVPRDTAREQALIAKYALLHCIVPRLGDLVGDEILNPPLRSEVVSFLAAKYCTPLMHGLESIGLTGGTPVVRFFDLIPPYAPEVLGITWRSLLATQRLLSVSPMGGSANALISRLLYSQPHTRGYTMPFINAGRRSPEYYRSALAEERAELDYAQALQRTAAYTQAAFLAVGTPEIDYALSATESVNPELTRLFNRLSPVDQVQCAGDILLRLLDGEGNPVGTEEEQRLNEALVYGISLDDLRRMVSRRQQVWVLAENRLKARIVRALLRAGLVNCLVIDDLLAVDLLS